MQYNWRIPIAAASVAGLALAVYTSTPDLAAQQKKWKSRSERTSEPGYSDTPVLPGQKWKVHDIARPHPVKVKPGDLPGKPPSDAVILFDGKDLSHWLEQGKGRNRGKVVPPTWKVMDGFMEASYDGGSIFSKEKFGDCQIHLEWAAPPIIEGSGQWRGNSGVLLMNRYEIQVLDSWNNPTYADGQAGAIYGQFPPLVDVSLQPGQWQTYDIFFEAPKFDGSRLVKPAYVTVVHNGVLVHHHQEIIGPMAHRTVRKYEPHAAEEPLGLQNHDTRARYRNIWVRRIKGYDTAAR